ncbi:MAG TPA: HEAT repeat domain-containing protein, partial [Polyangium sp.]|nr:HEAT repeat domain-containing protein [Polyangium sp.]
PEHADVRDMLVSVLDGKHSIGRKAAKTIAELAQKDPLMRAPIRDFIVDVQVLKNDGFHRGFWVFDAMVEHDEMIFHQLCRYTHDAQLGKNAWDVLLRHPKLAGVRMVLFDVAGRDDSFVSDRAVFGLAELVRDGDHEAGKQLVELLVRPQIVAYELSDPSIMSLLMDEAQTRGELLQTLQAYDQSAGLGMVSVLNGLVPYVPRVPEVELIFRKILANGFSYKGRSVDPMQIAVLGLAPLVARDPELLETLFPWLGARAADDAGCRIRRALATAIAPLARDDKALRKRLLEMLKSEAWQERQGAAWALLEAGDDIAREHLEQLRGVWEDERAEESWQERLHAAVALLNHPDPQLSRQALDIARKALLYGPAPWHYPLGVHVRQQAAGVLAQVQAMYQDAELAALVARALEAEPSEQVRDNLHRALQQLADAPVIDTE